MMRHVHLIGIGGTGMSSIARVLLEKGYIVSGSDCVLSSLAVDLRQAGVLVHEGHEAANIAGAEVIVRSSAIPDENIEVVAGIKAGIPVLKRSDFLGSLLESFTSIAVAGSHGKTTCSAMLAWSFSRLGLDPSYILGGVSRNLGKNAHAGKGALFVIEADEYDRMFLGLNPSMILLTSVDYDHPDCFPTREVYTAAFREFIGKLQSGGILVANADQPLAASMVNAIPTSTRAVTFGLQTSADYTATTIHTNDVGGLTFDFHYGEIGTLLTTVELQVPGEHNVANALGVLAIHHQLGSHILDAASALSEFKGTGRRFEIIGEAGGITIIDDYAHNPAKILATLLAAKQRFPGRRLVAVWQPHTYSRTRVLETGFVDSLRIADQVIVTDVYASREKHEEYPVQALITRIGANKAVHIPTLKDASQHLALSLQPGDVLIVLSAGDANQICLDILNELKKRKVNND